VWATHPDLRAEWLPSNDDKRNYSTSSNKKVEWICDVDARHVWQTRVAERSAGGKGCNVCSGRVTILETSIVTTHPLLVEEWDFDRNGDLATGSDALIWWFCCAVRHTWLAPTQQSSPHEQRSQVPGVRPTGESAPSTSVTRSVPTSLN
jgi:hypothetical protein